MAYPPQPGEKWGIGAYVLEDFGLQYDLPGVQQVVPVGRSPQCRNVVTYPGRVLTRPGLTTVATVSGNVVSIKEFVEQNVTTRMTLLLNDAGTLYQELGNYTYASVSTELVQASLATTLRMNSTTLFGREYMTFSSNGQSGVAVPLAYDGTNLYRVSPAGPGDLNAVAVSEPGAGNITAGLHMMRVSYLTSWGYITPPSVSFSWTAAGSKNVQFTNIPTGPSYVVARVLSFTAVADNDFFTIEGTSMTIADNTTTTVICDFLDNSLVDGTPISVSGDPSSDLLNLVELPAQSSVFSYNGRLCWLGERSSYARIGDIGFPNLSFDGGWATNRPLGWIEQISGESKGSGVTGAVGDYLAMTGNGTTQQALLRNIGAPFRLIQAGTEVRVRLRLKIKAGTTGTISILFVHHAADANNAFIQKFTIDAATSLSSSEWRVIDGQVLSAANNALNTDSEIRITGGDGATLGAVISNTGQFYVDYIELYNGATPYQPSLARWSRPLQPDAYDAVQGFQYVAQDNGQANRCGFSLAGVAYYCKDRSLYSTTDDGANEPAFWGVSEVSNTVGTPSPQGVGMGDQWVAIAGRAGLYYFGGGQPVLLSDDQRPTWNTINWLYGYTITCRVDMDRKFIQVAVPTGASTTPNKIFCFQWFGQTPLGQQLQFSTWTLPAGASVNCMNYSERPDGTRHFLMGTSGTSGLLVRVDDSTHQDWGNFIDAQYRTAFLGDLYGVKLYGAMRMSAYGQGLLKISICKVDGTFGNPAQPPLQLLSGPGGPDIEFPALDHRDTRAAVDFTINTPGVAAGDFFSLEKFAWFYKYKPFMPERGWRSAGP